MKELLHYFNLNKMNNILDIIFSFLLNPKSFKYFSIIFLLYNFIGNIILYSVGGVDYWEHLAAMHSYSLDLVNPSNPYLLSDEPTHLHTPYHLFWGFISKLLGIHVFFLYPLIAAVNSLLFLIAVKFFARNIINDERYSLPFALTMLVFWIYPWGYSGVYNLSLLPLTITYPYWFAFPSSIIVISFYGHHLNVKMLFVQYIIDLFYIFLVGVIFISHPLSAAFLVLCLFTKTLFLKHINSKNIIKLFLIPTCGLFLSILWPYFPVLDAILESKQYAAKGFADTWELFYKYSLIRISPSLLGVFFIYYKFSKNKIDFLSITISILILLYTLNYIFFHNVVISRLIIYIAFFGHIGIVLALKYFESKNNFNKVRRIFIVITLILLLPQLILSIFRLGPTKDFIEKKPLGTFLNIKVFNEYSQLNKFISGNDVVMAPLRESWILPGIVGCKVVGVLHSNPFMQDYYERISDTKDFFNEKTNDNYKSKILKKYFVKFIVVPKEFFSVISKLKFKELLKTQDFVLLDVN